MNKPFDRTIINPREKPLSQDINNLESDIDTTIRSLFAGLLRDNQDVLPSGFMSSGLSAAASSPATMQIVVRDGVGFQNLGTTEIAIDGVVGLNDQQGYKPIPLSSNVAFTVPPAPTAPNTRIDIIEVRADRVVGNPNTRQVLNESTGQFEPASVNKTLQWDVVDRAGSVSAPTNSTEPLSYKVGQVGNPGVAPATSPGYIKLAEISVGSDVTEITDDDIEDFREVLTDRRFKLTYNAANGYDAGAGSPVSAPPSVGTGVEINNSTWRIPIGAGIEPGDIIEDIEVIVEKTVAGSIEFQSNFWFREVDLDTLSTISNAILTNANTASVSDNQIYVLSHRDSVLPSPTPPGTFPFTWTEGSIGVMDVLSTVDAADDIVAVLVSVRRPIFKRSL